MGPMGPVALNSLAVKDAMRDFNVDPEEYLDFSSTVRRIASVIFNARLEKAREEMESKIKKR